jgi:hypothetical protein
VRKCDSERRRRARKILLYKCFLLTLRRRRRLPMGVCISLVPVPAFGGGACLRSISYIVRALGESPVAWNGSPGPGPALTGADASYFATLAPPSPYSASLPLASMSALPPSNFLPRELWDEIFRWLASPSTFNSSATLRPLLQVCRAWKVRHSNIPATFVITDNRTPLNCFSSANSISRTIAIWQLRRMP